jgi:HlyD family secretion protein
MRPTSFLFAFGTTLTLGAALTLSVALPNMARAQDAAAATAPDTASAALPAITVSAVGTRMMRDRVIASGLVTATEEVQITPMVQGQQVEELLVDVGDMVSAGQIIARLSSSALSLQKTQITAALEAAKSANDTAATTALQAELDTVINDLARAELTLKRTEVKSPVAGEIATRTAELGSIPGASGAPMFTVIRDGLLELQADVSESDLVRLAKGQVAELISVGASVPMAGEVRLVEPTVNPQTRLGRIRISFADSAQVRAGMFVEASILVAARDALAVPVTAVGRFEGAPTVMVIKDGTAERRAVTTGIRDGGWIEITEGLSAGETVVTKAGAFVRAGDRVNPVPQTLATTSTN